MDKGKRLFLRSYPYSILKLCYPCTHLPHFLLLFFFKTRQFQFGQILLEVILFRPCSFHLLNTLHFLEVQCSELETADALLEPVRPCRLHRLLAGRTLLFVAPAWGFCQLALHCSPRFLPAALLPTAACAAAAVRPWSGRACLVFLTAHQHSAFHSVSNPHPLLWCAWSPSKLSVTCKPSTAFSLAYHPNH